MYRLAEHLPDLPPEHGRRRRIHERHVPGDVEAEDAFTSGLEDEFVLAAGTFQGLLRPLHFRDMLLNRRRHLVKGAGKLSQLTRRLREPRTRVEVTRPEPPGRRDESSDRPQDQHVAADPRPRERQHSDERQPQQVQQEPPLGGRQGDRGWDLHAYVGPTYLVYASHP